MLRSLLDGSIDQAELCNCFVGLEWFEDVLKSLLEAFIDNACWFKGLDGSFLDFLRNGLFELNGLLAKKPDLRLLKLLSGDWLIPGICTPLTGACLVGEAFPDIGSALVEEDGFE